MASGHICISACEPNGPCAPNHRCNRCKQVRSDKDFSWVERKDKTPGKLYRKQPCLPCRREMHDPLYSRKAVLRNRYGLTWERFEEMLEAQGGGCAICAARRPGGQGSWHIDHDHSCCPTDSSKGIYKTCGACVRGVLCHLCNTALGCARDNVDILAGMIEYLESHDGTR